MCDERGNEQGGEEEGIAQRGSVGQMRLKELAKMSLDELLYYVLVGEGRRLRTGSL